MRSTVYVIKNKINGKCYVGQTTGLPKERFLQHKRLARMGKGYVFHAAIRKHGEENFEIIEETSEDIDKIDKLEADKVIEYNSCIPNGYNILEYGNVSGLKEGWWIGKYRGSDFSEKMSKIKKEQFEQLSEEDKEKLKEQGRLAYTKYDIKKVSMDRWNKMTEEQKQEVINRIKTAQQEYISCETAIQQAKRFKNISKANLGKVRTEEMKEHQRQLKLGKKLPKEHCENISKALKGHKKKDTSKMIAAQRARVSPEAKERVRKIRELSDKGLSNKDIAAEVGCGYEYVRKVRKGQRGV